MKKIYYLIIGGLALSAANAVAHNRLELGIYGILIFILFSVIFYGLLRLIKVIVKIIHGFKRNELGQNNLITGNSKVNSHQKTLLLISFVIFFIIPIYGLSHSLSLKETAQTRLAPGFVFVLEFSLISATFFIYKFLGESKKLLRNALISIGIFAIPSLLFIGIPALQETKQKKQNENIFELETKRIPAHLQILDKEYIGMGTKYIGACSYSWCNPGFRLVLKNTDESTCFSPKLTFTFSRNGIVEDTRREEDISFFRAGETRTENVYVETPLKEIGSYDWKVDPECHTLPFLR